MVEVDGPVGLRGGSGESEGREGLGVENCPGGLEGGLGGGHRKLALVGMVGGW